MSRALRQQQQRSMAAEQTMLATATEMSSHIRWYEKNVILKLARFIDEDDNAMWLISPAHIAGKALQPQ